MPTGQPQFYLRSWAPSTSMGLSLNIFCLTTGVAAALTAQTLDLGWTGCSPCLRLPGPIATYSGADGMACLAEEGWGGSGEPWGPAQSLCLLNCKLVFVLGGGSLGQQLAQSARPHTCVGPHLCNRSSQS